MDKKRQNEEMPSSMLFNECEKVNMVCACVKKKMDLRSDIPVLGFRRQV